MSDARGRDESAGWTGAPGGVPSWAVPDDGPPPTAPSWTTAAPGPRPAPPGAGAYGGPGPFSAPRPSAGGPDFTGPGPVGPIGPGPGGGSPPWNATAPGWTSAPSGPSNAGTFNLDPASVYGSPPPAAGRGISPHTPIAKLKDNALKSIYIGIGVIVLFVSITIGTFIFAPGGRFFVLFGPVLLGAAQVKKGMDELSHVKRVEREQAYRQPPVPPGW